jgi:hypothetical protein
LSNSQKVFDQVLSIDAWRTDFHPDNGTATVHADVSFLRGKFGDDPDSPVRFEVALKRAEIIFVIPANEPLKVIQSSVKREKPLLIKTETSTQVSSKRAASAAANLNTSSVAIKASADAEASTENSSTVKSTSDGGPITWAQSKNSEGQYKWDVAFRNSLGCRDGTSPDGSTGWLS